jgi:hypothetical protein
MANNQVLSAGVDVVDIHNAYGYPATAMVSQAQNETLKVHTIYYPGANGGLFANAPNGSILFNTTAGAGHIEIKTGTLGAKDGAWAVLV